MVVFFFKKASATSRRRRRAALFPGIILYIPTLKLDRPVEYVENHNRDPHFQG